MEETIDTFLVDKHGIMHPGTIYIGLYPFLTNQVVYMMLIRIKRDLEDYLVINQDGVIDGFTKGLGKDLSLKVNSNTNIDTVCLDWKKVSRFLRKQDRKEK